MSIREITHPETKALTSTVQTPIHILRHVSPEQLQRCQNLNNYKGVNIWVMFDRLEVSQVDGFT